MNNTRDIRILHLRSSNFYGGPERQIHFHARLANQSGVELTVSSFSENNEMPDFLKKISDDNIPVHLFNVESAYDRSSIGMIRKFLEEHSIDILCTHEYRSHFYGYLACKGVSTKWIAFSRGMTTENLKVKLFTYLERFVLKKASHIVAVSESQKQKLIKQSVRPDSISTIHNAIDLPFIGSIPSVSLRERFQFAQDDFVCISAGRFSTEKGQFYLVKAAETAIQENAKLRFVLFGDGPDLPEIKAYIRSRNLDKYIMCPGFDSNILGLIKSADLLINPSLSEGLPNIVLEALASDTPVLVTNVGGHPEIVVNGSNGYLVEPKNIKQLSEKILNMADNRDSLPNFSVVSRKILNDKFSFESQNDKLLKLYSMTLKNSPV